MTSVTSVVKKKFTLKQIKQCFKYEGKPVNESQAQAIKSIIDLCLDQNITLANQIAYTLATARGESNFRVTKPESFALTKKQILDSQWAKKPNEEWINRNLRFVKERGELKVSNKDWPKLANYVYSDNHGNGNEASGDGFRYRGRGYVQLTWKNNYEKYGISGEDKVNMAMEPATARKILVDWMKTRGLSDYVNWKKEDYSGARNVVNEKDNKRRQEIAKFAAQYEKMIQHCLGKDLVIVADTTGSMGDSLDAVKASAVAIVNQLFDDSPDSRIAVVGFNDPDTFTFLPFTDQSDTNDRKAAAIDAINQLYADGGDDIPEVVNAGLLRALSGGAGAWRQEAGSRAIILFGDAPPKDAELRAQVLKLASNIEASIETGATTISVQDLGPATSLDSRILVNNFVVSADAPADDPIEYPVQIYTILIGDDPDAAADFGELATQTGGKSLTASDPEALISAILESIDPSTQSPEPWDDFYGVDSQVISTFNLLANDADPNGDPLAIVAINDEQVSPGRPILLPSGASVTLESDGTILYDPTTINNFDGWSDLWADGFSYAVSDGTGRTGSAAVAIELGLADNDPLSLDSENVELLYVSYYGRPADPSGLDFWREQVSNSGFTYAPKLGDGLSEEEEPVYSRIVDDFGRGAEYDQLFEGKSNTEKVDAIYQHCFGRDSEIDPVTGVNYWVNKVDRNEISLAQMAVEVALGAQALDLLFLRNRIQSADAFLEAVASPDEVAAFAGPSAGAMALQWLQGFGTTFATSEQAYSLMDDLLLKAEL